MTSSRVSSLSRKGLSGFAALLFTLPWLAPAAFSQSGGSAKSGDEAAKPRSEYLNDGVFKIHVLTHYYDLGKKARPFFTTGLLVRAPNVILTARGSDADGDDVYDTSSRVWVCEQEPDPVRLQAKERELKDTKTVSEEDLSRFKEATGKQEGGKQKKVVEERIKANSAFLAEKAQCVEATIRRSVGDVDRSLVLIEAKEKLRGEVPKLNVTDPEPGTQVRVFGFPNDANIATRRSTAEERSRMRLIPTITSGTVVKTITDAKDGQIIVHQVPVSSDGGWGSPLVNNCDHVVGVNFRQSQERLVKFQGQGKTTGKNTGQVEVPTILVPTSNVSAALGAKELRTFLELNSITMPVEASVCTAALVAASFTTQLQQNMWQLFIGGSALLLASAAMVIALRRPGPVRNTVIRMLPARARARYSQTEQHSYRDGYSGAASHGSSDYMSDAARTDAYAPRAAPAALRADPTNIMAGQSTGGAKLVPIAGGQAFSLDAGRLGSGGLMLGRESDCDIVCDHSTISKQHARITLAANGRLQIEDLGSANGTWRGRNRIQREAFGGGDIVRFGAVEYRIELSGNGASSTLLMPSVSWELSGVEEGGRAVQWHLQPTADGSGRQVETAWIVGRSNESADLVLPDKRVSNQHAKIRFTPQRGLEICDLGSSNGTKVDGRKITDAYVSISDARQIEFGGSKMSMSKR
jgi:pSer/pThr/pTyr-binding forkhead associated (FHA) protein